MTNENSLLWKEISSCEGDSDVKNKIWLPIIALLGGVVGFGLRFWQRATAFDATTQLVDGSAPATLGLLAWFGLMALVAVVVSVKRNESIEDKTVFFSDCKLYLILMTISAFAFLAAAVLGVAEFAERLKLWQQVPELYGVPVVQGLVSVCCLLGSIGTLAAGKNNYKQTAEDKTASYLTFPAYAAMMMLIMVYQEHSVSAVLLDSFVPILSAVFLLLGLYQQVAFYYEHGSMFFYQVCAVMGVVFGVTSLADRPGYLTSMASIAMCICLLGGLLAYTLPYQREQRNRCLEE